MILYLFIQVSFILLIIKLLSYLTKYCLSKNSFRSQGIAGPVELPFFGTHFIGWLIKGMKETEADQVKKYGSMVALKAAGKDILMVTDADFIKQVFIKQFNNFHDHPSLNFKDGLVEHTLPMTEGEDWRRLRTLMTPIFSTGKLKHMHRAFDNCAKRFLNHLKLTQDKTNFLDIRSISECFTMDAIAETVFAFELNSLENPKNEFVLAGQSVGESFSKPNIKSLIKVQYPTLSNILERFFGFDMSLFNRKSLRYFEILSSQLIDKGNSRLTNNEMQDFVHLLLEASRNMESETGDLKISHQEIIAQVLLFFIVGFSPTTDAISFFFYTVAVNQGVQDKIRNEINKTCGEQGDISYEQLQQMKYLEHAIWESMRLYPAALPRIHREATHDTVVNGICIKKGSVIKVPLHVISKDPVHWKNPEEFNPDRFDTSVNEMNENALTLPFGIGPRGCIAKRLSMLEIKVVAAIVIQNNRLKISPYMKMPLTMSRSILPRSANKILLEIDQLRS